MREGDWVDHKGLAKMYGEMLLQGLEGFYPSMDFEGRSRTIEGVSTYFFVDKKVDLEKGRIRGVLTFSGGKRHGFLRIAQLYRGEEGFSKIDLYDQDSVSLRTIDKVVGSLNQKTGENYVVEECGEHLLVPKFLYGSKLTLGKIFETAVVDSCISLL